MAKLATVPDTMAANALQLLDAKRNAERSLGFGDYLVLATMFRESFPGGFTYTPYIEGGWQRMFFTFPDASVLALWADYGYVQRPNKYDAFAVATDKDGLPYLT